MTPRIHRMTAVIAALLGSSSAVGSAEQDVLGAVLPPEIEEALALSGAPAHLRAEATVYVFGASGFFKRRQGRNGITCLLNRDAFLYGRSEFKPTCWDVAGEGTYVPVMLRVGELLAKGVGAEAIRKDVDEGFDDRKYSAPTRGGVAYMLAGDVDLDIKTGKVVRQAFPGHYMFYAVGATTAQLGTTAEARKIDASLPSVFSGGAGGQRGLSYIISVPGNAHPH